jgi:hypothetical protein
MTCVTALKEINCNFPQPVQGTHTHARTQKPYLPFPSNSMFLPCYVVTKHYYQPPSENPLREMKGSGMSMVTYVFFVIYDFALMVHYEKYDQQVHMNTYT